MPDSLNKVPIIYENNHKSVNPTHRSIKEKAENTPKYPKYIYEINMELENKIISLNETGLQLLEANAAHSIFYLNQALLKTRCLSDSINKQKLLAMTFNNLGCYYNTLKQPDRALEYFQKSARLGRLRGSDAKSIVYSHLNIAGILSKKKDHEKAIRHALKSIHYLKSDAELGASNIATLITAYQVLTMEYLSLDQKADAKLCCETGLELSCTNLGKNNPKSKEISAFYENTFKNKIPFQKNRAASVITQRNLTPHHIRQRQLKNRLVSYISKPECRNLSADNESNIRQAFSLDRKTRVKKRYIFKNIDMSYVRSMETSAAVQIQAWWRGIACRKMTKERFIMHNIKRAEAKAQNALDEIQILKEKLAKGSLKGADELLSHINSMEFFTSKQHFPNQFQ